MATPAVSRRRQAGWKIKVRSFVLSFFGRTVRSEGDGEKFAPLLSLLVTAQVRTNNRRRCHICHHSPDLHNVHDPGQEFSF